MRLMTKTELKEKIAKAMELEKKKRNILANSGDTKKEQLYLKHNATVDTLFIVLQALNGYPIYLNILAGD